MKKVVLLIICFVLSSLCLQAQTTYLHCGNLIDGNSDDVLSETTIIIKNKNIQSIKDGYRTPSSGSNVVDLKTQTCLPGLIDMHVHLEGETSPDNYIKRFTLNEADIAFNAVSYAKTTLMSGFTTVRDVGGTGVNIALRDAINTGKVVGPRIFTAGKTLASTGGHADPTNGYKDALQGDPGPKEGVLNSPYEARKAVRQRYKNGANLIKITATGGVLSLAKSGTAPQFKEDELKAIVETANDYGFHVAVHAHGAEGMKRAIKAGIKTIEHGTYMDQEAMELMKKHNAYLVPTITAGKSVADSAKIPGYYPEVVQPKAKAIGPQIQDKFAEAYKNGVNIAFGTDAGVFAHGKNAIEFVYMTEAGMPAIEAIQTATKIPAQILNIDDKTGTVEEGKYADIIAVPNNPVDNIATLQNVSFVMKEGVIHKNN
ncbi:metal-dependent hydrolase family protein [Fodinibius halophilus]|uniref:Amidohydrolase family protein n=1 Tax=Fodinibius halophilus TaxID=1736908 RepID=A0A6M1T1X5_9BACT|nr:amidohydrolase family protein [Fodinibius halophilus]NGP89476.1 amidohydrolase family protein [Fodinibius halophilus]